MARTTTTQQVRVDADTLCRALRAAAAFCDADKKSHRYRINLRKVGWAELDDAGDTETDRAHLVVAAGGPTRVIVVNGGDLDVARGMGFSADISPRAAATIVKLFAAADGVDLKTDGKTLTVTATDALFDNHRLEVKQLQISTRADSVDIAWRIHVTGVDDDLPHAVAVTADTSACFAAAAKALGAGIIVEPVSVRQVLGVRARFGSTAVAWTRAHQVGAGLAQKWEGILYGDIGDEWTTDDVTLQHLLDGALPRPGDTVTASNDPADATGPIDLDALAEDDDASEPGLTVVPAGAVEAVA